MKPRTATVHTSIQKFNVGPFKVKQPLPADDISQVSPFILLHHGGPDHHAPGAIKARLSPHPHRGFEPVTFLFHGKLHHKDSTGSEGFLKTGDVQWMTAGSGIIHSEGPSAEFAKEGGDMEIIQLWVNLPRAMKMTKPKYQDISSNQIPSLEQDGFSLHLVAGEYKGLKGPASTFTPILAFMANAKEGAETFIPIPENYNALVYLLDGSVETNGADAQKLNMIVYEHDGEGIRIKAKSDGKMLILAGEPINEPVVSYGPFVMNEPAEIRQAILDYETGNMGVLEN